MGDQGSSEDHSLFFANFEKTDQISILKQLFMENRLSKGGRSSQSSNSKSDISKIINLWSFVKSKVSNHFGVFDSELFTDNSQWDGVSLNQLIYKVEREETKHMNLIEQLAEGDICTDLIRIVSEWLQAQGQPRSNYVVYLSFTIKGFMNCQNLLMVDADEEKSHKKKFVTPTIELAKLVSLVLKIYSSAQSQYDSKAGRVLFDTEIKR